jgi:dienelactone hydrolase
MHRRDFLGLGASLALAAATRAAVADVPFDPEEWLKKRRIDRFTTRTPQSDKPLQPLAAQTLEAWRKEHVLYEKALWELIGSWPAKRSSLAARVYEEKAFPQFRRFKVGFRSLPSTAGYASEIRAWLLVPREAKPPRPAIITLHQTLPQGKDEPAGVKVSLPWMTFATYYAERGYVTLAPDMIGYGERTTGGYERTGFELADAAPILDAHPPLTLLGLMLYDVTRCVDYLRTRPEVDKERIGVVGHSQGGILVNFVLGLEPRLRMGVASCGYGLFRTDDLFPERWAARNSAYLPRLALYRKDANALPLDMLQIMALAAPRPHLVQTALGDTIWSKPAVADNAFVMKELKRVRALFGPEAEAGFVSIEPGEGARDKDHGWYPVTQKAADVLFAKMLKP